MPDPASRYPRINVRIDPVTLRLLQQYAEATGVSISQAVKLAISELLRRWDGNPA